MPHSRSHVSTDIEPPDESEILALEREKIKYAIITDFILSVEIVIIASGTVINEPLLNQIVVVTIVALIATVGVYGIVALIVRMDEFGFKLIHLNDKENSISDKIGRFLVNALPVVIKALSVIGTIALVLVAGGILVHNISILHHLFPKMLRLIVEFGVGLIA